MEYPERRTIRTDFGYAARVESLQPLTEATMEIIVGLMKQAFIDHAKSPSGMHGNIVYKFRESQDATQDDSVGGIEIWEDKEYASTLADLAEKKQAVIEEYERTTGNKVN